MGKSCVITLDSNSLRRSHERRHSPGQVLRQEVGIAECRLVVPVPDDLLDKRKRDTALYEP